MDDARQNDSAAAKIKIDSGVPWEEQFGYCRAQRLDDRILVAGTTASDADGVRYVGDAGAQARFVLEKIRCAIEELGGSFEDVVRSRVYVKPGADWEAVAAAHGEAFGTIRPVNTLIFAEMIGEEFLVEIEVEAIVGAGGRRVEWRPWQMSETPEASDG
ncbi:MAG: RidA family protein [Acidobacteriota bacterium]